MKKAEHEQIQLQKSSLKSQHHIVQLRTVFCKRSVCDPLKLKMTPKVNYLGVTMTPENFFEGKTLAAPVRSVIGHLFFANIYM